MSQRLALIACTNGFGHIIRCLYVANEFLKNGWNVTFFSKESSIRHCLTAFGPLDGLEICDTGNLNFSDVNNGKIPSFFSDKISDRNFYTHVICDNFPEILYVRRDSHIISNFFWHRINRYSDKLYENRIKKFLYQMTGNIFCSEFFSEKYICDLKNSKPLGLYGSMHFQIGKRRKRDKVLISIGRSGAAVPSLNNIITNTSRFCQERGMTVLVDENIYSNKFQESVKIADFSSKMYNEVKFSIIRPGLGTVSDCIRHHIPILCVHEADNIEMKFNSSIITRQKWGLRASNTDFNSESDAEKCLMQINELDFSPLSVEHYNAERHVFNQVSRGRDCDG